MEEGNGKFESSGLLSYQQSQGKNSGGVEFSKFSLRTKAIYLIAGATCLATIGFLTMGGSKATNLKASMLDDIPPPPPPPGVPPPPAAPAGDPNAPPPPPAAPAAPAPAGPAPPAPQGPPPPTACQTGMVGDPADVPEDNNEMKACYLICDNSEGATPCDVNSCKSACWFGNDFCYNSCMGGCQYQAVGLTNGSRMACDGETCFSGCSYQCQKQCDCGVQKDGHCHRAMKACMLDEAIPGALIGDTVNYLCSKGPLAVRNICKNVKKLKPACQTGFGFAVTLASYYYSYTMSTVPQTDVAGVSEVQSACSFSGFGFIKEGAQHPCSLNYKGYGVQKELLF